ncbi:MAG: galactosyltransferase-related protein [Phycisphaerales bacterium]
MLRWRYDLAPEQDASFDDAALPRRAPAVLAEPRADRRDRARFRHRRYRRQVFWKRLGVGREHKPKVLGANFACTLADYRRINGHDETYEGWAQEDDDFGRRLYRAGVRPVVRLTDVLAYHQYHVTRAPPDWKKSSNAWRLDEPCETACARGLTNPLEQPGVRAIEIA